MKKIIFLLPLLIAALLGSVQSMAQNAKDELAQLMIDDSTDVNTIGMYSQDARENIFKVSSHPEGIVKIDDAQKKSQESFKNLISSYSKDEQQKIWNLTRYDGLLSQLASSKGKKRKTEEVLKKFPADIHDDAFEYATNHKDLIVSLDKMNKDFNSSFQTIVSSYSADDQKAFREMLNAPEAFSLLNKNMHMTVHLGDVYKTDAAMIRQQFDSLNLVLAEQKARETEEWKKEMKENPDAQKEMQQSADEYAKDNGIAAKEYANTDPKVVEHYVYVPYPYWCGYPYWYEYDYWYPYPYWYHFGYYYWNGDAVWISPPSWYFVHWHFHHHPHFYQYPHITNVYINHYCYGSRRTESRNSAEVRHWMHENETSLPRDFKTNNEQRIDRIKEFGKAEIDHDNFNKNNPGKNITRDEFVKQHADDYPHLKQPEVAEQPALRNPDVAPAETKPAEQPVKEKQKTQFDQPKFNPPVIKREPKNPVWKEPIQVKPQPQTPSTSPKQEQPRNQQVTPRRVPSRNLIPVQPENDKQIHNRKK